MELRDLLSVTAIVISSISLYFSLRKNMDDNRLDFVRKKAETTTTLELIRVLETEVIEHYALLAQTINKLEPPSKERDAKLNAIVEFVNKYLKQQEDTNDSISSLENYELPKGKISLEERIVMEDVAKRVEMNRQMMEMAKASIKRLIEHTQQEAKN
jgi:hypothetical protein